MSPCTETLLNVVNDQADNGIFWAVRSADKLIKVQCLSLEWTLNSSSPWWILVERDKEIKRYFFGKCSYILQRVRSRIKSLQILESWDFVEHIE